MSNDDSNNIVHKTVVSLSPVCGLLARGTLSLGAFLSVVFFPGVFVVGLLVGSCFVGLLLFGMLSLGVGDVSSLLSEGVLVLFFLK